jgi:hypothetical protein
VSTLILIKIYRESYIIKDNISHFKIRPHKTQILTIYLVKVENI